MERLKHTCTCTGQHTCMHTHTHAHTHTLAQTLWLSRAGLFLTYHLLHHVIFHSAQQSSSSSSSSSEYSFSPPGSCSYVSFLFLVSNWLLKHGSVLAKCKSSTRDPPPPLPPPSPTKLSTPGNRVAGSVSSSASL